MNDTFSCNYMYMYRRPDDKKKNRYATQENCPYVLNTCLIPHMLNICLTRVKHA